MLPYLVCEDIIKIYPQKAKIKKATLRGIDLTVNQGEFISILGPSGCGKTTLLLTIAGLLEPSAGSVKIGDKIVNALSSSEKLQFYRKNIGLMFQNPQENVLWDLSTFDNILLPMSLGKEYKKREEKKLRVLELLKQLHLENKASKKPNQLSGGELQRIGLGIASSNNPDLLLLDEPTSQVDTPTAITLVKYLQSLCTDHKKTIIMVTHDLRLIKQTDHCFLMKEGVLSEIKLKFSN